MTVDYTSLLSARDQCEVRCLSQSRFACKWVSTTSTRLLFAPFSYVLDPTDWWTPWPDIREKIREISGNFDWPGGWEPCLAWRSWQQVDGFWKATKYRPWAEFSASICNNDCLAFIVQCSQVSRWTFSLSSAAWGWLCIAAQRPNALCGRPISTDKQNWHFIIAADHIFPVVLFMIFPPDIIASDIFISKSGSKVTVCRPE